MLRRCLGASGLWSTIHAARRFQAAEEECPFKRLDLPRTATKDEIRGRFRELAKIHHPDVGGDETTFRDVHDAYNSCMDQCTKNAASDPWTCHQACSGAADTTYRAGGSGGSGPETEAEFQQRDTSEFEAADRARRQQADEERMRQEYERMADDQYFDFAAWERRRNSTFRDREEETEHERARREFTERFSRLRGDAKAVDDLFHEAMLSSVYRGYDIGEPLYLALNRYHHCIPLGEEHLARCFAIMQVWEKYTHRTPSSHYYHVLLQLYSGEESIVYFNLDASTATDMVAQIMQRMMDCGVQDESVINWWETLRLSLMQRFNQ